MGLVRQATWSTWHHAHALLTELAVMMRHYQLLLRSSLASTDHAVIGASYARTSTAPRRLPCAIGAPR